MSIHAGGRGPGHLCRSMGNTYPDYAFARDWKNSRYRTGSSYTTLITATGDSYTRSGAATAPNADGSLASFAANEVRRTTAGVLIEESRANLTTYSEAIGGTNWSNGANLTAALNTGEVTAPTGASTATKITAGGADNGQYQTVAGLTASTVYTWSFYARLGTMAAANFRFAIYDATNLAFIASDIVPNVTPVSTGWVRITYTFTTPDGCTSVRVYPYRYPGSNGTAYVWGGQLELGSFPTSYAPRPDGAASVRAVDALANTSVSVSGDVTVHGVTVMNAAHPANQRILDLNDGTDANKIVVERLSTGGFRARALIASVDNPILDVAKAGARTLKWALVRSGTTYTLYADGALAGSVTAAGMPTLTRADIGAQRTGNGSHLNGTVEFIGILNRAMTTDEAIAVTS